MKRTKQGVLILGRYRRYSRKQHRSLAADMFMLEMSLMQQIKGSMMLNVSPLSPHNATTQLTTFKSYVALIADPTPGSILGRKRFLGENLESSLLTDLLADKI
ncbi:hypothetical protein MAR_006832 [Mya arenaria]|uniref:Uncharacterized protein n=1 Tax=Mya arenaria TaxID=6604 RepID=A0ABY7DBD4_MYAAR|nr:hypothetical protein MAR_006832 [Mya arenaria]